MPGVNINSRGRLVILVVLVISIFYFIYRPGTDFFPGPLEHENLIDKASPRISLNSEWTAYKANFISPEGRVIRPLDNNDTVSEGQAYAMLRAVWLGDQEQFDQCYFWTEKNLKRSEAEHGDTLLAWHWEEGRVQDWMPASDADIDYALALILAGRRFGKHGKSSLLPYHDRALEIISDIKRKLVRTDKQGKLNLSPWIEEPDDPITVNLSYYSPAHFQVFFEETNDPDWLSLKDRTYELLFQAAASFNGETGRGLFPDWAVINNAGSLVALEGRNSGFGWEAVRIPFRIYLDHLWNQNPQAVELMKSSLHKFAKSEYEKTGKLYSEYPYSGSAQNPYESSTFYGAFALASKIANDAELFGALNKKVSEYKVSTEQGIIFEDSRDYYRNSLSWFPDGVEGGVFRERWGEGE